MTSQQLERGLSVSIVIGSRFHAFELARELSAKGLLHRLVTGYPRRFVAKFGIPAAHVAPVLRTLLATQLTRRVPSLAPALAARTNADFAARAARQLDGTGLLHGWSGYSVESLRWAKKHRIPSVVERSSSHIVTQMEILEREYAELGIPFKRPDQRWMDRDLEEYELADLIAVPSLFAMRSFLTRGFKESRLLYAPFGASLESFSPGPKTDDVFRVVYAGSLSAQKGIHHLVEAFNEAQIANGELCLVGSATPETDVVLRKAKQGVRRVPHVPQADLVHIYRSASVFVMASVQEGMATVQAQALACGVPLVCSAHTGGEDLLRMSGSLVASHPGGIEEYPAGYVVPVRDPGAIATCLQWLASDEELLARKRVAATYIRSQKFGWSDYADRVVAGYRRILAAG